jgi:hypothetical protein
MFRYYFHRKIIPFILLEKIIQNHQKRKHHLYPPKVREEGGKEQTLRLFFHIMEGRLMVGRSSLVLMLFRGNFIQTISIHFIDIQENRIYVCCSYFFCTGCSLVEKQLGKFVDEAKAKQLESRLLPIEGCAVVAGRTDKGVTALQQVCSFC